MIDFIDLFSGIGGFRKGLEDCGRSKSHREDYRSQGNLLNGSWREDEHGSSCYFKCVWSCDNNKYANQVYTKRFGAEGHHSGDIRRVNTEDIPDFDLLCAGFPCQSFSVAGKRKGFKDTRGTLFFEICRIARAKRPSLLLLENVKGLLSHDGGRTFTIILQSLDELGYWLEWQVLNSKYFGVPQNRERVFVVGHLREGSSKPIFPITGVYKDSSEGDKTESWGQIGATLSSKSAGGRNARGNYVVTPRVISTVLDANYWKDPDKHDARTVVIDYLNKSIKEDSVFNTLKTNPSPTSSSVLAVLTPERVEKRQHGRRIKEDGEPIFTLTDQDVHGIMEIHSIHYGKSQQDRLHHIEGISPTVPVCRTPDKLKIIEGLKIRRLTPLECERLQGFPDQWTEFGYVKDAILDYEPVYGWKEKYDEETDEWEEFWGIIGKNPIDPIDNTVRMSDTQRYRLLGNAVTVNVIELLGELIKLAHITNIGDKEE